MKQKIPKVAHFYALLVPNVVDSAFIKYPSHPGHKNEFSPWVNAFSDYNDPNTNEINEIIAKLDMSMEQKNALLHPKKPYKEIHENLLNRIIETYTQPHDIILDICAGVGSVAIAALSKNRRIINFELDPTISTILKQRIELKATSSWEVSIRAELDSNTNHDEDLLYDSDIEKRKSMVPQFAYVY